MKIRSVRQQFLADHSATNYLFYAAKPLSKEARAFVGTLSSHVDVEPRSATITYNGEFADLDDARRRKFLEHFDVEVRESYDWWSFSVVLDKQRLPEVELATYQVEDEASVTFDDRDTEVVLLVDGLHLDYASVDGKLGEDTLEGLAELALQLRQELYDGEFAALRVLKHYCEENEAVSLPAGESSPTADTLSSVLEAI
ncbi:MAG: hypothetical protein ACO1SX_02425 [Actinomycetota bacterium]